MSITLSSEKEAENKSLLILDISHFRFLFVVVKPISPLKCQAKIEQTVYYILYYFSEKVRLETSYKLSAKHAIHMNCQTHTRGIFPIDRSNAFPLLQFFVCVSLISYMALVVSLFVPHLSFLWGFGSSIGWHSGESPECHHILLSEGPCFVIVAFPRYFHLYVCTMVLCLFLDIQ